MSYDIEISEKRAVGKFFACSKVVSISTVAQTTLQVLWNSIDSPVDVVINRVRADIYHSGLPLSALDTPGILRVFRLILPPTSGNNAPKISKDSNDSISNAEVKVLNTNTIDRAAPNAFTPVFTIYPNNLLAQHFLSRTYFDRSEYASSADMLVGDEMTIHPGEGFCFVIQSPHGVSGSSAISCIEWFEIPLAKPYLVASDSIISMVNSSILSTNTALDFKLTHNTLEYLTDITGLSSYTVQQTWQSSGTSSNVTVTIENIDTGAGLHAGAALNTAHNLGSTVIWRMAANTGRSTGLYKLIFRSTITGAILKIVFIDYST